MAQRKPHRSPSPVLAGFWFRTTMATCRSDCFVGGTKTHAMYLVGEGFGKNKFNRICDEGAEIQQTLGKLHRLVRLVLVI